MALREDQVTAAVRFLGNDKVAQYSAGEKEGFLARKGLTSAEIAEAFRRFERGDDEPGAAPASAPGAGVPA
eukprot:CAMPEP_0175414766 /NCGR_PEP_ID=MMETSP0095-20121207/43835_1 /TAXON_ID=311494 /ORGANISM="Alexandrium monilatum, Strain CCMP3105" /LENGTH=70 /DNA_ID=CAMNT_0016713841 /DNA_START=35 /DNA_END=243 /DNA_ORIENTATION=+